MEFSFIGHSTGDYQGLHKNGVKVYLKENEFLRIGECRSLWNT